MVYQYSGTKDLSEPSYTTQVREEYKKKKRWRFLKDSILSKI